MLGVVMERFILRGHFGCANRKGLVILTLPKLSAAPRLLPPLFANEAKHGVQRYCTFCATADAPTYSPARKDNSFSTGLADLQNVGIGGGALLGACGHGACDLIKALGLLGVFAGQGHG